MSENLQLRGKGDEVGREQPQLEGLDPSACTRESMRWRMVRKEGATLGRMWIPSP